MNRSSFYSSLTLEARSERKESTGTVSRHVVPAVGAVEHHPVGQHDHGAPVVNVLDNLAEIDGALLDSESVVGRVPESRYHTFLVLRRA